MHVSRHIFLGAIFSLFLLIVYPKIEILGLGIIFLSSVLIDIDHYLYYIYRKKDWNLRKAYNWFIEMEKKFLRLKREERNKTALPFCFLHGFDLIFILFIGGLFINKYLFFVGIGFSFHLLMDMFDETKYKDRIDKASIIYDFLKYKKLFNLEV